MLKRGNSILTLNLYLNCNYLNVGQKEDSILKIHFWYSHKYLDQVKIFGSCLKFVLDLECRKFDLFLEARAEIRKMFSLVFWKIKNNKISFWDFLVFIYFHTPSFYRTQLDQKTTQCICRSKTKLEGETWALIYGAINLLTYKISASYGISQWVEIIFDKPLIANSPTFSSQLPKTSSRIPTEGTRWP